MRSVVIAAGVAIVAVLVAANQLVRERNELETERNDIGVRWARVERDMKQHAELASLLLEAAGANGDEQPGAAAEVARARAMLLGARSRQEEMDANAKLQGAVAELLAFEESRPDLKSDAGFVRVEDQLEESENRIAEDRRDYNDAIRKYNLDLELFPKNLAASIFGLHRDDAYFRTANEQRQVRPMKF